VGVANFFWRFVGVKVGVADFFFGLWALLAWLALRRRLRNLNLRSHFSIFDSFRYIRVHIYDFLKFMGLALRWAWQTFFGSIDRC